MVRYVWSGNDAAAAAAAVAAAAEAEDSALVGCSSACSKLLSTDSRLVAYALFPIEAHQLSNSCQRPGGCTTSGCAGWRATASAVF